MDTNHPTTEFFFVFAFTYCKLRVYRTEERFAQKLLETLRVEMLTGKETDNWHEVDTRLLLDFVARALPLMIKEGFPRLDTLIKSILTSP